MSRVSVIVPNYNHAAYLRQRLDSIVDQTYRDFELIILDDASTDDSRRVIEHYATLPGVKTVFNEANAGNTFVQWQRGLALAEGEYVWLAESDDVADEHFLERMVAALDSHPTAGLAVCNTIMIGADGLSAGDYFAEWKNHATSDYDVDRFEHTFFMEGRQYLRNYMIPWNTIPNASGVLFRKERLLELDQIGDDLKLCGDWAAYCRLLLVSDIVRVPERMNFFRQHLVNARTKHGFQFIPEALSIQRKYGGAIGVRFADLMKKVGDSYVYIALERWRGSSERLPPGAIPAALAGMAKLGPNILFRTVKLLARERVGALLRRRSDAGGALVP